MRLDPRAPAGAASLDLPGKPVSVGYDAEENLALVGTLGDRVCIVDLDTMRVVRQIATASGPDPVFTASLT